MPKPTFIETRQKLLGFIAASIVPIGIVAYSLLQCFQHNSKELPIESLSSNIDLHFTQYSIYHLKRIGSENAEVADITPTGIYFNVPYKEDLVFIRSSLSKG